MTEPLVTPQVSIREATPKDDRDVARLIHGFPSPETTGIAGGPERAVDLGLTLFSAGVGRSAHDETYLATLAGQPVGVLLGRCAEATSRFRCAPSQRCFVVSFVSTR